MIRKTHSGLKKHVKVKKSGTITRAKAGKRHLLINKSKRQKKTGKKGIAIPEGHMNSVIRRLARGKM